MTLGLKPRVIRFMSAHQQRVNLLPDIGPKANIRAA